MRILLVRLGALGDIVHALPVAAALREAFPSARLDWLVDERHRAVLELVPVIDRRIPVRPSVGGFLSAARSLRDQAYDVALDLQGLWKSGALARASGAARVVGFSRPHLREPGARLFYTETCGQVGGPHVIQKNLSLLRALGVEPDLAATTFPLTVPDSTVPAEMARRLQLRPGDRLALVNPCAAWPNKRWPPERYGRVAAALARRHQIRSAIIWGPGEQARADAVVAASEGSAAIVPATTLGDLLALAREACLMVSGDTGPLHLAAAVGTPIVALCGPTDAARNGPWAHGDIAVSRYASCACRYERRCRRASSCLDDIDEDEVLRAVDERLSRRTAHA